MERAFHQPGKHSACVVTVLSQCLTIVSLHLDRMNYILHGITLKYTVCLQWVHSALNQRTHPPLNSSALLKQLLWLPLEWCMKFKLTTLTSNALHIGRLSYLNGSEVLERPSTWLSGRQLPSCRLRSSRCTVSCQYDAGHPSYDDFTGRQSICPWSVTVAVNLRKAAENLFVCLRVAALVTYELAPWKCTD